MKVKKKKYVAVFLVSEQGTFSILKFRRFNPSKDAIQYTKGVSHLIDVSKPTYAKGLKLYYFVDIKKGQLGFDSKKNSAINPEVIDMILKQNIVKQLTTSLSERFLGSQIVNIVIGLVMGILIGIIAGGYM